MFTTQTKTNLANKLEKLICVSKPYYALQNIQQIAENQIQAEIEVENLTHGESTLICGAEAGRHLAILGSCALALQNPIEAKHYYLANQAYITRGSNQKEIINCLQAISTKLIVRAKVVLLDLGTKKGKVETQILTMNGDVVFNLDVSYQVLKGDLFQKLFRKGYTENARESFENPYINTVDIDIVGYDEQVLSGDLGIISASQCVGHFDDYPALPIAILSGGLSKLAGMHLKIMLKNNDLKYALKKSSLSASRLAFAGEHVFVHSTFIASAKGEYTFYAKATNEKSEDLGDIEITFDLLLDCMNNETESTHYFSIRKNTSMTSVAL